MKQITMMPAMTCARILIFALVVGAACAEDTALFESKIRPILVEHCYECHSADKKQKGSLLLDTKEATLKGGDTGPAIIPGDPAKSLLIQAVKWEGDLEMPPKKKLTDTQIADLEAWIKAGAPDPRSGPRTLTKIEQHLEDAKKHWSLQPVVDPKPASLDALIGLKATPAADKRTLIRRACFDLLGVPPTYAEVNAFAADNDPKAFEKLIDKLLSDTRYGERWGRHWLDVARYADNMGSIYNGDDTYPNAYTYRDYVIDAFNSDKPYDRFVLEQIAADQLDTAKNSHTLAGMGFLGLGRRKDRKLDDDTLDDTIDVIGRGLMGLTVSCARCHDHKLEPITTKDYYAIYSILKSSKEPEIQPSLPQEDTPNVREYAAKNKAARTEYIRIVALEADRGFTAIRSRVGDYLQAAHDSKLTNSYKDKKIAPEILDPRRLHNGIHNRVVANWDKWVKGHPEIFRPWLELSALPEAEFNAKGPGLFEAYAKNADKKLHPAVARGFAKTKARSLRDIADIYNQLYSNEVDALWAENWREHLRRLSIPTAEELDLPIAELEKTSIDRIQAAQKNPLPDAEAQQLRSIFIEDDSPFVLSGKDFLSNKLYANRDVAEGLRRNATKALSGLQSHPGAPARAMTFVDADKMHDGKVFIRGNPNTPGAAAPRQFLTALRHISPEAFPKDKSGRLQLAQAITSPKNPLTARVIVNRVWAWHFGEGIVGTPSDFGFRGDKPTNQPLLDHLAAWFIENGWSFKKLHKHLMLTAAYQRADFPIRPLELEPFRDTLLAVSGRLKPDLGGKAEKIAETTRRTVYGFVDRKTQPSLYRSFDFPDPNFSAPKRSRTALTPRALILMNSPLLTDSAKNLAAKLTKDLPDDTSRIEELYRRVFQRQPTDKETQRAHDYLAAYPKNDLVHPESQDWQYGFGEFDAAAQQVKDFASLANFDGKAFKGTGVMLDAMGGDPGASSKQSTVRRWIAPLDGQVNIAAELIHMDEKSDGVVARILSSRAGQLGEWTAKKQAVCTDLTKIAVKKGDTLDFIVSSVSGKDAAAYQWSPSIIMPGTDMPAMPGMARRWDARVDFANPKAPQKPLSAWEELCQAILLSPEFAVME